MYPFQASAHQGKGICTPITMAAPWDANFLTAWDNMLNALATHLKQTPSPNPQYSLYDFVTLVRITGINRTTDEFRIPAEILSTQAQPPAGCDTNSIDTWLTAGYRPSLLFSAWDSITRSFDAYFSGKYFNVPLIGTNSGSSANKQKGNGQFPFPPIDENGCVYSNFIPNTFTITWTTPPCFNNSTTINDQNLDLIVLASQKFPGQLTTEVENLTFKLNVKTGQGTPSPAHQNVLNYAESYGAPPAYSPNNYFGPFPINPGGTSCGGLASLERCFSKYYGQMLETGIGAPSAPFPVDSNLRSQFLEVFFPDVYGDGVTGECSQTPPPPPNRVGSPGYQTPVYPGPGCAYPNEIKQAHADLIGPPVVSISFPPAATATRWFTSLPIHGSVSASSAIGQPIQTLTCQGAASGSGASGFTLTVNHQGNPAKVVCVAQDASGNAGESIRALWVDTKPPVTSASATRSTLGAETVTLSASDNISGVAQTRYHVNGGPWYIGTVIGFFTAGTYTVEYQSVDVAGNVEKPKSITVVVQRTSPKPPPCTPNTCI
jgi:hypothetical protein